MENPVKNIIFDLGGVLLNVDYEAPVKAFAQLGVTEFESLYSQAHQARIFDALETGELSPDGFRQYIREKSGLPLTDAQIDGAWNSILLDFPADRAELLYALKDKYRLFLLSNTNNIHITAFEKILEDTFGKNIFSEVFERYYYSSSLGMRKPDVAVFEKVIQLNDLCAGDTLFIDDSAQHVNGAKKAGLQTLWLDVKKSNIVSELSNFL